MRSIVKSPRPISLAPSTSAGQYSTGMLLRRFISETAEGPTRNTLASFTFEPNAANTLWRSVSGDCVSITPIQHYSCRIVNMFRVACCDMLKS